MKTNKEHEEKSNGGISRRTLMRQAIGFGGAAAMSLLPYVARNLDAQETEAADKSTVWISTTREHPWQRTKVITTADLPGMPEVEVQIARPAQTMEGFGGCFNELGWTSLQALTEKDQAMIFRELFAPGVGANFSLCRLPIGANDFSRNWYSYDETAHDFTVEHFSVANDLETLIPFVKKAQEQNPRLRFWSSPWSPPSWMKHNRSYAEALQSPGRPPNGLKPGQVGQEGQDMFIQERKYLEAYAKYFGSYIDAYKKQGISIGMVMPQNEFNSAQPFPSCTWTPEGLARFIACLGPVMAERHVQIFFGTLERGNMALLQAALNDPVAGPYIKGVGLQWAGKQALSQIHQTHPHLTIYQSEQECGDGKNDWEYCGHCWSLMKDYLMNGASGYMYWNISLAAGGLSRWGWPQNSLITVDAQARTYRFNHEYYLLKHVSHFVLSGATRVETQGSFEDVLAFHNPDGTIAVIARNESPLERPLAISTGKQKIALTMKPQSFNSVLLTS